MEEDSYRNVKMAIADFLNRTGTIQKFTEVADDYSDSGERTYSDLVADIPCRLRKLSASEQEEYMKRNVNATHRCYILPPAGISVSDIKEKYRFITEGKTFDIIHVDDWNFQGIYIMMDMVWITWE